MDLKYTAKDYTVSISVDEYIRRFRDAERFMQFCKECANYNKVWVCPPFKHDLEEELRKYGTVSLIATKIMPSSPDIPLSESHRFIRQERLRIEKQLLEMEREDGGRAFAFAGSCLYCPADTCTRCEGLPCRHPELVRPSLEAYGFDIGRTTSELFGIELLWSKNGFIPEYLTLVCGFFH